GATHPPGGDGGWSGAASSSSRTRSTCRTWMSEEIGDEPGPGGAPPAEPAPPGDGGGAGPPPGARPVNIEDEVRRSFLDYSMSVIVSRALPDVRDGLKPVHRRILYAMQDEGLLSTRPFSKSAGV